ncbi:DUF3626 domain-containing protein [Kineococcus aurantiacus]|uniref:DUF3626 domain-containing protein n=1 Tax=Kineococcus aurantiacus TaxID=37633 RepID=A0A7Y9DL70_9ACTN|nr:hypothetical protein [Kineococcus aurantiacus]
MHQHPPPATPAARAVAHVDRHARGGPVDPTWPITVHFHPDRPVRSSRGDAHPRSATVLRALTADGRYRSQFETGTGNGGLTAHPGGDRWSWESRLFAAAYDTEPAAARPVYGSLNHARHPVGGSPRFGSAHLRLRAHVLTRTTFCYPDSAEDPVDVATAAHFDLLRVRRQRPDTATRDLLDDYVEAHVHGGLLLGRDVEALVLDPSHRGTDVEDDAHRFSRRFAVALEWHPGFATTARTVAQHPGYRGADVVAAAARVAAGAPDGTLTPRVVGVAARAGAEDEQVLKRVWHCTARFGWPSGGSPAVVAPPGRGHGPSSTS